MEGILKAMNMDWIKVGIFYFCLFIILTLFGRLSFAGNSVRQAQNAGDFSGSVEAEGWYTWWVPFTSRNEEKGILTQYEINPALLYGATVSMRSEGRGFYALQYLTSQLEGEIKSKAIEERRDRVAFEKFVKWRGDIGYRITGDRFLYTRLTSGGFNGRADFKDTASFAAPQRLDVNSQFVTADLLWMRFTEKKSLFGFGLRLINYRIPAVTYKMSGDVITESKFTDTEFRSYSVVLGLFDGSRVSKDGKSPEIPFMKISYNIFGRGGETYIYLDDFLLYLGYGESDNSVMGYGRGMAVGMEFTSGFRKEWDFRGGLMSFNVGVRSLYNLLSTYKGGSKKDSMEITTEDMFFGPFLNLRWVF